MNTFFDEEDDMATILSEANLPYKKDFEAGFKEYIKGDWG